MLRLRGTTPPFPPYAFMACAWTTLGSLDLKFVRFLQLVIQKCLKEVSSVAIAVFWDVTTRVVWRKGPDVSEEYAESSQGRFVL